MAAIASASARFRESNIDHAQSSFVTAIKLLGTAIKLSYWLRTSIFTGAGKPYTMATYQREVWVDAPFEDVWAFYSTIDGLVELTPEWMHLRVEAIRGPDGESNPDVLEAGTQIRMSLRPFGIGPRQRWVSTIVEREADDTVAMFRDEMSDGPFPEWQHTHQFYAGDGRRTLVRDEVAYRFPALGETGSPLAKVGFEPMFRYRHRKTRKLLER